MFVSVGVLAKVLREFTYWDKTLGTVEVQEGLHAVRLRVVNGLSVLHHITTIVGS